MGAHGYDTGSVVKDKYRLDRKLGVGGMATVFAATHLRNGSRAALKVLHGELRTNIAARDGFFAEGRLANSVGHSGVVRILDDEIDDDGTAFLVMELLEGEAYYDRLQRCGPLSSREVAWMLHELLDAVAAVHAKGIVHRDITPSNVFLTRDGKVRLLDFGNAVVRNSETPVPTGPCGTPAFMAPEQVIGGMDGADEQCDVWGVGATAFTLLSAQHVHSGHGAAETMLQCLSRPAPPLGEVAPQVDGALAQIIDRALRHRKEDRWPSARAMQAAVAEALLHIRGEDDAFSPGPAGARIDESGTRLIDLGHARSAPGFAVSQEPNLSASIQPTRTQRMPAAGSGLPATLVSRTDPWRWRERGAASISDAGSFAAARGVLVQPS